MCEFCVNHLIGAPPIILDLDAHDHTTQHTTHHRVHTPQSTVHSCPKPKNQPHLDRSRFVKQRAVHRHNNRGRAPLTTKAETGHGPLIATAINDSAHSQRVSTPLSIDWTRSTSFALVVARHAGYHLTGKSQKIPLAHLKAPTVKSQHFKLDE